MKKTNKHEHCIDYELFPINYQSLDKDGNFINVNNEWLKTLGYKRKDIVGKSFASILDKEGKKIFKKRFAHFKKTGEVCCVEFNLVRKGGAKIPVEFNGKIEYDEKGKMTKTHCAFSSITERKKAEELLRENQERLDLAVQVATDLIYEWDVNNDQLQWFGDIDSTLGYKKGEIPRTLKGWLSLIHPNDQPNLDEAVAFHRKSTKPIYVEYRIKNGKGDWNYWLDRAIPVLNEKNKPIRWIGTCTDITSRKLAEEEMQKQKERYQTLFESSRDAIMTLEPPEWMFTSGNPSTVEMFACKSEKDFTSRAPWQFSPPRQSDGKPSGPKAKAMIMKAMREGSNFFEWTHRRKNGEDFPATVLLTRMTIGDKTFLQATVRDIKENKEIEKKIDEKMKQMEFMGRTNIKHHKKYLDLQQENKMLKRKLEKYEKDN